MGGNFENNKSSFSMFSVKVLKQKLRMVKTRWQFYNINETYLSSFFSFTHMLNCTIWWQEPRNLRLLMHCNTARPPAVPSLCRHSRRHLRYVLCWQLRDHHHFQVCPLFRFLFLYTENKLNGFEYIWVLLERKKKELFLQFKEAGWR